MITRHSITVGGSKLEDDDFIKELKKSPLPTSVIPNYMGINLCNVDSISWEKLPDGQLINLSIQFHPDMPTLKAFLDRHVQGEKEC